MQLNVRAIGTARDPVFTGHGRHSERGVPGQLHRRPGTRNGTAALQLAPDRVTVERLRVEDARSRVLELVGSLGTHELRVGELAIDARAQA